MPYNQDMGIDTVAFLDTDLKNLRPSVLHKELEKRIGKCIYLRGYDESPYPNLDSEGEDWSLYCGNLDLNEAVRTRQLTLRKNTKDFFLELGFYNNTFEIEELEINGRRLQLFDYRFNQFCELLSENTESILKDLKDCIEVVNQYLRPIIHASRLFLCGDQVYVDGKEVLADKIFEGMSIDQAIEFEANSIEPNPLYTWDNLDILMKDYIGWGIFDFDLDKLPTYITSIQ